MTSMEAFLHTIYWGEKMPRVKYRDADVDLMARMMRAEAEGEGNQGMLYVGNVIVNRAVADCLDFKDVRTIGDVLFQIQGGNYSFEAVQKGDLFYQRARSSEKRLAKRNIENWRQHPAKYPFGTLIHMLLVLQHGTINLLPVNLKIIVFMNLQLGHVQVFITVRFFRR